MSIHQSQVADGGLLGYEESFLGREEADALFAALKQDVPWCQEKTAWGRLFPRLTAWYADPGLTYTYSGVTHHALDWTEILAQLRCRVEAAARAPLNSLLLNYYRGGDDSMGYHADDEPESGANPIVPSLSLGASRRFVLRHNTSGEKITFELAPGSLLIMAGTLQHFWKHSLPKVKGPVGERINLTFRNILREG